VISSRMRAVAMCIAGALLVAGLVITVLGIGWLGALLWAAGVILALVLLIRVPRGAE
jgi:Zn-dependent membrane protease YugP